MATFLTTRGTSAQIESIIVNATRYIVFVSPYISGLSGTLLQSIVATGENLPVQIIYREEGNITPQLLTQLKLIKKLKLFRNLNLHAKVYFNEKSMVVTSMNLSGYAEISNWEIGFLLDKTQDADSYKSTYDYVIKIRKDSEPIQLTTLERKLEQSSIQRESSLASLIKTAQTQFAEIVKELAPQQHGYCIRCGDHRIKADWNRPYCLACFVEWETAKEDNTKVENRCHICGRSAETSLLIPACMTCIGKITARVAN